MCEKVSYIQWILFLTVNSMTQMAAKMKQFFKFGIAGIFNSVINYIIYIICIKLGMHYIFANIIGFIIVIYVAYLEQNYFVFRAEALNGNQVWWKILLKTYVSYGFTGLLLTNLLSVLWLDIINLAAIIGPLYQFTQAYFHWQDAYTFAEYIVPFLNLVFVVPVNYVVSKYWTYR